MPEIKMQTDDLINFSEAARLLKVTRTTIYAMIQRGELHPFGIADRRYLFKEEIEGLIDEKYSNRGENTLGEASS